MQDGIAEVQARMQAQGYVADRVIATAVYLAGRLGKPLLIEGPAGVGKTEVAKVLADTLGTDLIRLQCYEGLDAAAALYEWNFPKQMLRIKLEEAGERTVEEREETIFSQAFLLKRPLLEAITRADRAPVLLVDEVDRADEEFEAFLLEVLSDFQVSIPELGTIRATHRPHVVLTSNRSRELSDALRRRCLYLWIDYPDLEKEVAIVKARVPGVSERLAVEIGRFMGAVRRAALEKPPGVAETLDWAQALLILHRDHLDREAVELTLPCLCKSREDLERVRAAVLDGALKAATGNAAGAGAAGADAAPSGAPATGAPAGRDG